MQRHDPIDDLDCLALADGLLDDDPARKAEVEAAVARDPEAASRVADYRAQTLALRAAYAGTLAERVPERLLAVVERADRARERPVLRRVAAGLMIIAAGVGGWFVGQEGEEPAGTALLEESYRHYVLRGADQAVADRGAADPALAIGWIDNEVAIRLTAPDLLSEGYSLVGKRGVQDNGEGMVALDYRSGDGRAFSLFIAPRWTDTPGPIVDRQRDGVALAYWHDGPIAASIATQLPRAEARALAETVRRAMRDDTTAPPVGIEPDFRPLPTEAQDVMADTLDMAPQGGPSVQAPTRIPARLGTN